MTGEFSSSVFNICRRRNPKRWGLIIKAHENIKQEKATLNDPKKDGKTTALQFDYNIAEKGQKASF